MAANAIVVEDLRKRFGQVVALDGIDLEGSERQEAWRPVVSRAPGYGNYQERADRIIPLVRLRAEEDSY